MVDLRSLTGRPLLFRSGNDLRLVLSVMLAWLLQRLPFMTHLGLFTLCFAGPVYSPRLLAFFLVAVHVIFLCCQTRLAYAIYSCWKGTQAHAAKDWMRHYFDEKKKLEVAGQGEHILRVVDVQHVIIVPAYKEDTTTLCETLDVLASHPLASQCYHICLGMEEREAGSSIKAENILRAYRNGGAFADITYTVHPGNILGESAGKSSNVNWATRHMYQRGSLSSQRAIYTIMDADTAFASDFFLASAVHFALAAPSIHRRMMFIPPIIFDRNCKDVPIFTRATDIFWACAGIGGIYPSSSAKIPTSAYGVSMQLAHFCDFWDAGPEAIGEDLHFFTKAMFETKGNIHGVTIYSPASQCNVMGKAGNSVTKNYLNDMGARWTQATRHLWGSLDFGYFWYRVLTGRVGHSRPRHGYQAINAGGADSHDEVIHSGKAERDTASSSRTPSPTYTSDSSTLVVDSDLEMGEIPSFRPRKSAGYNDDSPEGKVAFNNNCIQVLEYDSSNVLESGLEDKYLRQSDEEDDNDDEDGGEMDTLRVFPLLTLMVRLYEAHLMVAQVFLFGFLTGICPSVIYSDGSFSFIDTIRPACTLSECVATMFQSTPTPFDLTRLDNVSPYDPVPIWMIPQVLHCGVKAARLLAIGGIISTITVCLMHDCYHNIAAHTRWVDSDKVLLDWQTSKIRYARPPPRYLGIRPEQTCRRQWPRALLDFAAIPAGLLYGIAPLLYAQTCHLFTNKLTYTVSAKSKNILPVPTGGITVVNSTTPLQSAERVRTSLDVARIANDEKIVRRA